MVNFKYDLPNDRIAMVPPPERGTSRLLVRKNKELKHELYKNLPKLLPSGTLLVLNNTRVIAARMKFRKMTGGEIEIFLLEPEDGNYACLHNCENSTWKCLVGGAKKWKNNEILHFKLDQENNELIAQMKGKTKDHFLISFSWSDGSPFEKIIATAGEIPLPPYIKREVTAEDKNRYQTVFAHREGSVAAPTAGLHFTENLINELSAQQIDHAFVTLHVGAGTFKPVTATVIIEHSMHEEFFQANFELISQLADPEKTIVPVGTTSLRTIESLYWIAVKSMDNKDIDLSTHQYITQWEHLDMNIETLPSREAAFFYLKKKMLATGISLLQGYTGICIAPGYSFRVAAALITNFHQPQSTLLLIIAAIMGDEWKKMYTIAVEEKYRFLSYGDGSLLFIDENE